MKKKLIDTESIEFEVIKIIGIILTLILIIYFFNAESKRGNKIKEKEDLVVFSEQEYTIRMNTFFFNDLSKRMYVNGVKLNSEIDTCIWIKQLLSDKEINQYHVGDILIKKKGEMYFEIISKYNVLKCFDNGINRSISNYKRSDDIFSNINFPNKTKLEVNYGSINPKACGN